MDRLGVNRALARAGARNGDTIHIGRLTFSFEVEDQLDVQPFDYAPDRGLSRSERRELLDDIEFDEAGLDDGWDDDETDLVQIDLDDVDLGDGELDADVEDADDTGAAE
jgi:hypothetical protein